MSCLRIGRIDDYCADIAKSQKLAFSMPLLTESRVNYAIRLANSDDPEKRAAAASKPWLPVGRMEALSKDESPLVRSWLTRNPQCPDDLLKRMAESDPDPAIRAHANYRRMK